MERRRRQKRIHSIGISGQRKSAGTRIQVETTKKRKEVGVHRFGQVATLKGDILENGKYPLAIIAGLFAPEINIKDKVGQDGPSWFLERGRKELSLDRLGKRESAKWSLGMVFLLV